MLHDFIFNRMAWFDHRNGLHVSVYDVRKYYTKYRDHDKYLTKTRNYINCIEWKNSGKSTKF